MTISDANRDLHLYAQLTSPSWSSTSTSNIPGLLPTLHRSSCQSHTPSYPHSRTGTQDTWTASLRESVCFLPHVNNQHSSQPFHIQCPSTLEFTGYKYQQTGHVEILSVAVHQPPDCLTFIEREPKSSLGYKRTGWFVSMAHPTFPQNPA